MDFAALAHHYRSLRSLTCSWLRFLGLELFRYLAMPEDGSAPHEGGARSEDRRAAAA